MLSLDLISFNFVPFDTALLLLSFTLCLSLTAGGMLVVFRFRQSRRSSSFHYLQYFLILLYVYGYYSLWSGILLAGFMDIENVERVATLVAQMGAPFYLVSLGMLLLWTARVHERRAAPLVACSVALSVILILFTWQTGIALKDTISTLGSLLALSVSLVLFVVLVGTRVSIVKPQGRPWVLTLAATAGLMHLSEFMPFADGAQFDTVFVLFFYLFNTALVVVYAYQATDELMQPQLTLDDFLHKYAISRREADILRGIYAGKTNQEIANQLFISLQTVKDHSSRIYQKTFVKNRAQLSTLIRESQDQRGSPIDHPWRKRMQ